MDVSVICFDTVMQQSGMPAFVSTATHKNNEGIWLYTTAPQRALRPHFMGILIALAGFFMSTARSVSFIGNTI